jgi:hypothetical protein
MMDKCRKEFEKWLKNESALLTNVEARYIAKVVHKLLAPKGVKHESACCL